MPKTIKYKQGKFTPINYKKYIGDPTNIIFRSSWEKKIMEYLDSNPNIIRWSSEEIVIPYYSPVDNRWRRYFPDFYLEAKEASGGIKKMLLEVKPKAQTQEPKKPQRTTKRYITEVMTYGTNKSKWDAAIEYCKDRGWEFRLITETELFKK